MTSDSVDIVDIVEPVDSGVADPVVGQAPPARRRGRPPKAKTANAVSAQRGVFSEPNDAEIWEAVTASAAWVQVRDRMNGGWKQVRVGGEGGPRRLQLSVEERRWNQDLVPEENIGLDPFANGQLLCVQGGAKTGNHLSDDELTAVLRDGDDATFQSTVEGMESEIVLRRLQVLAERKATMARYEFVREIVDTRYRVGGTQRAVQALLDAGEALAGFGR